MSFSTCLVTIVQFSLVRYCSSKLYMRELARALPRRQITGEATRMDDRILRISPQWMMASGVKKVFALLRI